MNHQTRIPVSDPLRSEASTSKERSSRELHEHIFSSITVLAGLLPLKQAPPPIINLVSLGMNHQTSIPVGDPLRSEASTSREHSTRELQEHTISFITMLIGLLQLKQGVFDTDYLTLVSFIVALIVYRGSLIGPTYIRQAHPNSDLAKLMDKISLPFGALTLVLGLVILVRVLGLALLCVWIVWFASFVANDLFMYLKTLYESAVAGVVEAFEKLKEYLKNMNMIIGRCFTTNSEDQAGLP